MWAVVGAACFLASAEVELATRFALKSAVKRWVAGGAAGVEPHRSQMIATGLVALLFVASLFLLVLRARRHPRGESLALPGVALSFAVLLVEAVSLHEVAPLLYRPIGPLPLVAWLWIAGAGLVASGAATTR